MKNVSGLALLAAAGACAGLAASAFGQGCVINISGATLLENYVRGDASTNDYIDYDADGVAGSLGSLTIDQLAPFGVGPGFPASQRFVVQYRSTGSTNGFFELVKFGSNKPFVTTNDTDVNGILGGLPNAAGLASNAYNNRKLYIQNGAAVNEYTATNPGGAPNRSNTLSLLAVDPSVTAGAGTRIDVSPLDVATSWAVLKGASTQANWARKPFDLGYGNIPTPSKSKTGATSGSGASGGGLSNKLVDIGAFGRNLFDPLNPGAANADTIFDTEFLFAPIAPVVNPGTGLKQVKMTELQHLFTTGRAVTGENLMVHTRDIGSGTRNAFMNCIGVDPSWGNGDNIGLISTAITDHNLGANYRPTNKGSNGGMELSLRNNRLGIGYIGTERGVTGTFNATNAGSWLANGAMEIADVQNDIYAGDQGNYVRPTTFNLVNNDLGSGVGQNPNAWLIGGQAVLASVGDPKANAASVGGWGWNTSISGETGTNPFAGRPAMTNTCAAGYINNIRRSVGAFVAVPGGASSDFMPGELAAQQFLLIASLRDRHDLVNPTLMIANPEFNAAVQTYTLGFTGSAPNNVHSRSEFASFNAAAVGKVPQRTVLTSGSYSDGVALGANYINQGGANIAYLGNLNGRNRIAGDFNGDFLRDVNDANDMIAAWRQRNGGPVWAAPASIDDPNIAGVQTYPGSEAIIEVLGDFDGNGSFDKADLRYFGDGLALKSGKLNRRAGFKAIENAWFLATGSTNFFNTTLATGKAFSPGDARGDVANILGLTTPGFAPIGADAADGIVNANDNVIDGYDIDYVYKQFVGNAFVTDGSADWANLNEAVGFDLSADMTGELSVNQADVCVLVKNILKTTFGDVNLDGTADSTDTNIITGVLPVATFPRTASGWRNGDLNGDRQVNQTDLDIATGVIDPCNAAPACVADVDDGSGSGAPDGGVGIEDLLFYLALFEAGDIDADVDDGSGVGISDGGVGIEDLLYYLARFESGC